MYLSKLLASRRSATSTLESHGSSGAPPVAPREATGRSIVEASPVGSSGSNGFIERGVQGLEGQARTIKLAFESQVGMEIPSDHNLIPWIIEYDAVSINRGQLSSDGKTAYERLKGKPASLLGLELGENSMEEQRHSQGEADSGIFLGQRTLSGYYSVGIVEGMFRPRTIHRRPVEKR